MIREYAKYWHFFSLVTLNLNSATAAYICSKQFDKTRDRKIWRILFCRRDLIVIVLKSSIVPRRPHVQVHAKDIIEMKAQSENKTRRTENRNQWSTGNIALGHFPGNIFKHLYHFTRGNKSESFHLSRQIVFDGNTEISFFGSIFILTTVTWW